MTNITELLTLDEILKYIDLIYESKTVSINSMQVCLGIGFNKASRVCAYLEAAGICSPKSGIGPRTILIDKDEANRVILSAYGIDPENYTKANKINSFITAGRTFFLATVDNDQPKLRPLGAHIVVDNKVIFGVGDFKDVYKELVKNPKCELVSCHDDGKWMRYTGKAVFETDPKYAESMLNALPHLRNIYNETTGNKMMCFYIDGTASVINIMGPGEEIK